VVWVVADGAGGAIADAVAARFDPVDEEHSPSPLSGSLSDVDLHKVDIAGRTRSERPCESFSLQFMRACHRHQVMGGAD
jgi:hypothetical protein